MYYNFHGEGGCFLASSYYIDHKGVYFKGCGLYLGLKYQFPYCILFIR